MRLVFVASAILLAWLVADPPSSAQALPRPRISWSTERLPVCDRTVEQTVCVNYRPDGVSIADVTISLRPGERAVVEDLFATTDGDIIDPRPVLQTANGTRVMRFQTTVLPPELRAGDSQRMAVLVDIAPSVRSRRISGRMYLRDRGSYFGLPLNVRVNIIYPTPAQLAATPVVVPSNRIMMLHDRVVLRDGRRLYSVERDRFNIPIMTVLSGTTFTWTNRDGRDHAVLGVLCDPDEPYVKRVPAPPARIEPCAPVDPVAAQECLDANPAAILTRQDDAGEVLCFRSPRMGRLDNFVFRLENPDRQRILRYFVQDGLNPDGAMTGYIFIK